MDAGRMKAQSVAGADILLVRENVGGVYQGEWRETADEREGRLCEHSFRYSERQVRRILGVAARLAACGAAGCPSSSRIPACPA
jgi:isocitrate/isopropylmalate dehydrogenase